MIITDFVIISNLIFAFSDDDVIDRNVVEHIKLNEFSKKRATLCLYSLKFKIHKHSTYWIACYQYTTDPKESVYDPPVYDIAIQVPAYTNIFIDYLSEESLIKPYKRKLIARPVKKKKNKGSSTLNAPSVYTAYAEK